MTMELIQMVADKTICTATLKYLNVLQVDIVEKRHFSVSRFTPEGNHKGDNSVPETSQVGGNHLPTTERQDATL